MNNKAIFISVYDDNGHMTNDKISFAISSLPLGDDLLPQKAKLFTTSFGKFCEIEYQDKIVFRSYLKNDIWQPWTQMCEEPKTEPSEIISTLHVSKTGFSFDFSRSVVDLAPGKYELIVKQKNEGKNGVHNSN